MKKHITVLALLILLAALLTSCASNGNNTDTDTESTTESESENNTDTKSENETQSAADEEIEYPERFFIFRIWNFTLYSTKSVHKVIDTIAEDGFNAIKVHVPWAHCEKVRGEYDFTFFDDMVDYVVNEKGLFCALSLDLTRHVNDPVFSDDQFMKNPGGALSVGSERTQISFADKDITDAAVEFYGEAVKHFNEKFGKKIIFYLPAFSQYCETEYWCGDNVDFSAGMRSGFADYCAEIYEGDVEKFNRLNSSTVKSFDQIKLPSNGMSSHFGMLMYQYKHKLLKDMIDRLADVQHTACPGTKFAIQLGCVWDSAAAFQRITLGFEELCEKIDILWVDDSPTFNHRFSCDYLRSNLPEGVELAQEIDGPSQVGASQENYLRQGLECYQYGCRYVSIANWGLNEVYESYKSVWDEIISTWLGEDHPDVITLDENSPVIELNISDVFKSGGAYNIQSKYNSLSSGSKAVRIKLTDDMLHENPN